MKKNKNQHPEQRIQEEWMKWLKNNKFTYEGYEEFMTWRYYHLLTNSDD